MARSARIQVTVSPLVRLSIEHLARRSGLTLSAQAMVLLRQATERTSQTAEVQRAYRAHVAHRNHATWLDDQTTERAEQLAWEGYVSEVEAQGGGSSSPIVSKE